MSTTEQTELAFTPAHRLRAMIEAREVSPREVVEAALARIEAVDGRLNAMLSTTADTAREAGRLAEQAVLARGPLGPLHGLPVTVKDLLNTAGVRTTFGSYAFEDNVPEADCVAVGRLKAAGAILIGKTTTPEFGHKPLTEAPLFGRTLNPWNLECTPGGSSGGAGAAAAAGYGPLHVGTDGGGSIRIPAACCGVVGMKATLGVVPHDQTPDSFANLAYIGPMTRSVADAGMMLQAMAGPDASDLHSLGRDVGDLAAAARPEGDLKGVRIGWRTLLGNKRIDGETRVLFEAGVAAFAELGANLKRREGRFANTMGVWGPLTFAAWAARFGAQAQRLGPRMSESLSRWIDEADGYSAVDGQQAAAARTVLFREVQSWFEEDDLIVTPTLSRPALAADHDPFREIEIEGRPSGTIREGWYPYTHPFNLTGHPAITVPCGWTEAGLPVGLQIVGPWLGDARVLRAAALFESVRPWAARRPALD